MVPGDGFGVCNHFKNIGGLSLIRQAWNQNTLDFVYVFIFEKIFDPDLGMLA